MREKQLRDIQLENIGLAKRLEHTKPVIRTEEMVKYPATERGGSGSFHKRGKGCGPWEGMQSMGRGAGCEANRGCYSIFEFL